MYFFVGLNKNFLSYLILSSVGKPNESILFNPWSIELMVEAKL